SAFSESLCVDDDPARIRVLTGHATAPRTSSRIKSRQSPTLLLTVRGLLLAWMAQASKLVSRECLRKEVSDVLLRVNISKFQFLGFDALP
ncbi:hypothetical protein H0H92_015189, partial [Tricholoma furcatifolium]